MASSIGLGKGVTFDYQKTKDKKGDYRFEFYYTCFCTIRANQDCVLDITMSPVSKSPDLIFPLSHYTATELTSRSSTFIIPCAN